jgi:hypothetical protein
MISSALPVWLESTISMRLEIQAVAASIDVPVDLRTNGFLKKVERDGPPYEH